MIFDYNLDEVLEQGVIDRKLSDEQIAFLETIYEEFTPYASPNIGSAWTSGQLDIPGAIFEIQQVGALLDFLKPLSDSESRPTHRMRRFAEVTEALVAAGCIGEGEAQRMYDDAL